MSHNAISSDLSNEIANNFLANPLRADLRGKVHAQDMGTDMVCFLTHNSEVSVKHNARNFLQFVKTFRVIFFLQIVKKMFPKKFHVL